MLKQLFYCTLLTLLLTSCKGRWYKMGTTAMEPNIPTWSLVSIQEQKHYSYGDIVVMDNVMEYPVMYRIVALAGDSIAIEDHICRLNGIKFKTEFVKTDKDYEKLEVSQFIERWTDGTDLMIWINKDPYGQEFANMSSINVPDNCVYVLGDYRAASVDSREFGAVPITKIKGKIIKIMGN